MKAIPDGEERILLATGRYIGEGFDDSCLDTLFLVMPILSMSFLHQIERFVYFSSAHSHLKRFPSIPSTAVLIAS